jgi:hypothetical protein
MFTNNFKLEELKLKLFYAFLEKSRLKLIEFSLKIFS